MGFNMKTWGNPVTLDANNLNRIEQGIKNSHDTLEIVSEEVSNLQNRHSYIIKELNTLIKDAPNVLETLNNVSSLLQNNDISAILSSADNFLMKKKQSLTNAELKQVYKNLELDKFLKLTSIKVNGESVVEGSEVNITLPTIDNSLNINSNNAISNAAVVKALKNNVKVPTKLSELKQEVNYQTVTTSEKAKWNKLEEDIKNISFTETDPTVPSWAKSPTKPLYDYAEILNTPSIPKDNIELLNGAGYITSPDATTISEDLIKKFNQSTIIPIGNKITSLEATDTAILNELSNLSPLKHKHTESDITDLQNYALSLHTHTKSEITNFNHTHTEADITDLQNYALSLHTHTKSEITDFNHTHTKSEITDFNHTHTEADITDLQNYALKSDTEHINAELVKKSDITYVDQKIADLVGSAPDTLNTLEELAEAFKNNSDVIKVLNEAIATKANTSDLNSYLPKSGGDVSGDINFTNSSSWLTPYLLAFKNADTSQSPTHPYTGFYQWGNEWQVNARDANNAWAKNIMSINLDTAVATFGARPTVNGSNMVLTSDLENYVTTNTPQTISGAKTFTSTVISTGGFSRDGTAVFDAVGTNEFNLLTSDGEPVLINFVGSGIPGKYCSGIYYFGNGTGASGQTSGAIHCGSTYHTNTTTGKKWKTSQDDSGNLVFTYS